MCKDAAAICCNQEREKGECQRGIDLIQSGKDCPNDGIKDNIQRGARGRLWCTNNNISLNNTFNDCCFGCKLGTLYKEQKNTMMCKNIASNLMNGHMMRAVLECCNVTRQGIDRHKFEAQENVTCPAGFTYNQEGMIEFKFGYTCLLVSLFHLTYFKCILW